MYGHVFYVWFQVFERSSNIFEHPAKINPRHAPNHPRSIPQKCYVLMFVTIEDSILTSCAWACWKLYEQRCTLNKESKPLTTTNNLWVIDLAWLGSVSTFFGGIFEDFRKQQNFENSKSKNAHQAYISKPFNKRFKSVTNKIRNNSL